MRPATAPPANAGLLELRQLLTDAAFATIIGNDWADKAAGKGMAGKTKDAECVRAYADAYLT